MVEGALVFPIMAMFMVMFELAHHSFDGYITAEHVARERAWSGATIGSFVLSCPKGRDDTSYTSQVKYFTIDGLNGSDESQASTSQTNNTGVAVTGPGGWAIHHATAAVTAHADRGAGHFTTTPNARSKVFCNQPWVGGLVDIFKSAFGIGKSK